MSKLKLSDAKAFAKAKEEVSAAYEKLDKLNKKLIKKYGEGEFEYERKSGGAYRLAIVDNLKSFKEGNPVYISTSAHRYSVSLREVKHLRKKK